MRKNKVVTVVITETIIGLLILFMFSKTIFKNNEEKNKKIEVFPITYESGNDLVKTKLIEEDNNVEIASKEIKEKLGELDYVEDKKGWYLSYKEIIDKHSSIFDPPETIYNHYTEEEIYLIQRCVETECYGGDFESKVNVANVIFNRINSEDFDDNVTDVITANNQFSYWRINISEDTKLAVEYAFAIEDTTNGCIAFHSNEKRNKFNNWNYVFTDSIGHHFYG